MSSILHSLLHCDQNICSQQSTLKANRLNEKRSSTLVVRVSIDAELLNSSIVLSLWLKSADGSVLLGEQSVLSRRMIDRPCCVNANARR